ncbi:hypothetical protein EV360DRAFT_77157 [Lentinula raphanica]|nr:hypothetical protein EV360DRAFT_77157 [Lentinula raphanica]
MSKTSTKFQKGGVAQVVVLILVLLLPIVYARPTPPVNPGARDTRTAGSTPLPANNAPSAASSTLPGGNSPPPIGPKATLNVHYEISYPDPPNDFYLPGCSPSDCHPLTKMNLPEEEYGKAHAKEEAGYAKLKVVKKEVDAIATAFVNGEYCERSDGLIVLGQHWGVRLSMSSEVKDKDPLPVWYPSYELKPGDVVHFKLKVEIKGASKVFAMEKWLVTARQKKGWCGSSSVAWKMNVDENGATYPELPVEEESGSWCSVM